MTITTTKTTTEEFNNKLKNATDGTSIWEFIFKDGNITNEAIRDEEDQRKILTIKDLEEEAAYLEELAEDNKKDGLKEDALSCLAISKIYLDFIKFLNNKGDK